MDLTITIQTVQEKGKEDYLGCFASAYIMLPGAKAKEKISFAFNIKHIPGLERIATKMVKEATEMHIEAKKEAIAKAEKRIRSPYITKKPAK